MGNTYLVRPATAISHEYNMNAYSDFSVNGNGIWFDPTSGNPTLKAHVQGAPGQPGVGGFDQLEAIMSKADVMFQYVNGSTAENGAMPMSTSVVITFPTKHFHYSLANIYPFTRPRLGSLHRVL